MQRGGVVPTLSHGADPEESCTQRPAALSPADTDPLHPEPDPPHREAEPEQCWVAGGAPELVLCCHPSVPTAVPRLARGARRRCLHGSQSVPQLLCQPPLHPPGSQPALFLTSFPYPSNFPPSARFDSSSEACVSCSGWLRAHCRSPGVFFPSLLLEMSTCPLKHITWAGSQELVLSHQRCHCPLPALPKQGLVMGYRLKEPFLCSSIRPGSGCNPGGCTCTGHQGKSRAHFQAGLDRG